MLILSQKTNFWKLLFVKLSVVPKKNATFFYRKDGHIRNKSIPRSRGIAPIFHDLVLKMDFQILRTIKKTNFGVDHVTQPLVLYGMFCGYLYFYSHSFFNMGLSVSHQLICFECTLDVSSLFNFSFYIKHYLMQVPHFSWVRN